MTSLFAITAASNTVLLGQNRAAETTFTVANTSGRAVRGRAKLGPDDLVQKKWLQPAGDVERDFAIAGAQQYVVKINVPPNASAGNYSLRLDMVGVENPDADYTEGPTVAFQVPQAEVKRKFPWWIVAAAAVIVILAVTTGLVFKGQADSRATATARAAANATTQTAQAAASLTPQAIATQTAQAAATGTAQAAATMTAQAAATLVAQQTVSAQQTASAAATATAQAFEAAIAKYDGTWANARKDQPGLTRLIISHNGKTITAEMFGQVYEVRGSGGVAMLACPLTLPQTSTDCPVGKGSATYSGDPVTLDIKLQAQGLVHRLTLAMTPDGSQLGVTDNFLQDNKKQYTNGYTIDRKTLKVPSSIFQLPEGNKLIFMTPGP
jgi:hypothetical protein